MGWIKSKTDTFYVLSKCQQQQKLGSDGGGTVGFGVGLVVELGLNNCHTQTLLVIAANQVIHTLK